jgi:rhomboid protease GluP
MCASEASALRYDLQPRGAFVALEPDGLRIALHKNGARMRFVPYTELTHCEASARGLWLASTKTVSLVRRPHFAHRQDPEALAQAIRERISGEPGGEQQLERMSQVGERGRRQTPRRVTVSVSAICVALVLLQLRLPLSLEIGSFVPALVREGDLWRIVTANFLHELSLFPVHLMINVLCLLAFGVLVERPLGGVRTFVVMAVGAVGAMAGSYVAGYEEVIGASGMVAALAGAVLWLEFHAAERMPAWWRLPRRLFVMILVLQALADLVLPFVAGAAHLGGFVAGYLTTGLVSPGALEGRPAPRPVRWVAAGLAVLGTVAFVEIGQLLLREGAALEQHARRLLALEDVEPGPLNDLAWRIATEFEHTETQLQLAIQLAAQAVERSGRSNPDILDTLAEVRFTAGDRAGAIEAIDEAIVLTGGESYFFEQRRRFNGERDPDDRPSPPAFPWSIRKQLAERFFGAPAPGS